MVAIIKPAAFILVALSGSGVVSGAPFASAAPYATSTTARASPSAPAPTLRPAPSTNTDVSFGITCDMFNSAVVAGGSAIGASYPTPSTAQCSSFLRGFAAGGISSAREAAMFLANMIWESDGLRTKEEYLCKQSPSACYSSYGAPNAKGDHFWGRGYIQISWAENYIAASQALFGDERLFQNPQLASYDEGAAWGVSFWYWKTRVHSIPSVPA
ncbi:lysozyme-like protein [Martensiomyces pterosporus]|nr:lysozyme-like protein [Martensiomyces pterosporus]